jgi:hypothetical protein
MTRESFEGLRSGAWDMGVVDREIDHMTDNSDDNATAPSERIDSRKNTINSKKSFGEVTAPRQVAALYFYQQLDCLIDYAHEVACDFFRRPQQYLSLGDPSVADEPSIAPDLARLGARYGSDERIPSHEQRDAIFAPIFGESSTYMADGQGDFSKQRDNLLEAAAAFAERAFDDGVDMLRDAVRLSHQSFKVWLIARQGDSLDWSTQKALVGATEDLAYKILRNPGVAAVFGRRPPPKQEWPYVEDGNADLLIEEISKQLPMSMNSLTAITSGGINSRQRAALRGAEALATIIDFSENDPDPDFKKLDLLITRCYTWRSALKNLPRHPIAQPGSEPAGRSPYAGRDDG